MKKRPFLLATLTVGGIFLFFLLVVFTAGYFHSGSMAVSVGDKIGVLEVEGPIDDAKRLIGQIRDFRERGSIKAVVLRVNSPGGGVGPSQEIYAELKKLATEKPLIVSMGSVAASVATIWPLPGREYLPIREPLPGASASLCLFLIIRN